jgi:hypothetical protein
VNLSHLVGHIYRLYIDRYVYRTNTFERVAIRIKCPTKCRYTVGQGMFAVNEMGREGESIYREKKQFGTEFAVL